MTHGEYYRVNLRKSIGRFGDDFGIRVGSATSRRGVRIRFGLTVVELLSRGGAILRVRGVDMLDGTPILDIKPISQMYLGRTPSRLARGSRSACQCKIVEIWRSGNSRASG
jgi:hypothetical protein